MKNKMFLMAIVFVAFMLLNLSCKRVANPNSQGLLGKLETVTCGYSELGPSLWIRAENGKLYQPCKMDMMNCVATYYFEGDVVRFTPRPLTSVEGCDQFFGCDRNTTKPDEKVGIVSLVVIKPSGITKKGVIKDYSKLDGCSRVFEAEDGEKYEIADWFCINPILEDEPVSLFFALKAVGATTCMVGKPISCREVTYLKPPSCKQIVIAPIVPEKQTVEIINVWQEGNQLKFLLGFSGCSFDPKPINLVWDGSVAKTNPAQAKLALANMPEPQMCQAYFQKIACFDIANFKNYGNTLRLSIEGYPSGSLLINF